MGFNETCNESVRANICLKHFSSYSEESETGRCIIVIIFQFALKYTIRKDYKIQEGVKLNARTHLLVYADGDS